MYIHVRQPIIKCSQCGSNDIARTLAQHPSDGTCLVCLSCGHRGSKERSPFAIPMDDKHSTAKIEWYFNSNDSITVF